MATFARVGSANDAAAESSKIVTATLQIAQESSIASGLDIQSEKAGNVKRGIWQNVNRAS